jgi:hypothetical protein
LLLSTSEERALFLDFVAQITVSFISCFSLLCLALSFSSLSSYFSIQGVAPVAQREGEVVSSERRERPPIVQEVIRPKTGSCID